MLPEMTCTLTTQGWINLPREKLQVMTFEALEDTGKFWHDSFMPWHFQAFGRGKYHYAPRAAAYERRKQRKFGHQDPLVFTGAARNLAMLPPRLRRFKSTNSVTVVLPGLPKYFYYKPVAGKRQPDKMGELGRVAADEGQKMAGFYVQRFEGKMNEDASVVFHSMAGTFTPEPGPWSPTDWSPS